MKSTGMHTQYLVNTLMFGLHGPKAMSLGDGTHFLSCGKDGTWRQQFLICFSLMDDRAEAELENAVAKCSQRSKKKFTITFSVNGP